MIRGRLMWFICDDEGPIAGFWTRKAAQKALKTRDWSEACWDKWS